MNSIDLLVAELKSLSPGQLQQATSYIYQLRQQTRTERNAAIRNTSAILTSHEADQWIKVIEDCERIDESAW